MDQNALASQQARRLLHPDGRGVRSTPTDATPVGDPGRWGPPLPGTPAPTPAHQNVPGTPTCPLLPMTYQERLDADFRGTGLTLGKHPMALRRAKLEQCGVLRAMDLCHIRNGAPVRIAGSVIVRQRPGTAKGFVFLSLEDETGIANAIVTPDLFDRYRMMLVQEPFLLIEGILQNVENVASVKATNLQPLEFSGAAPASHDFF